MTRCKSDRECTMTQWCKAKARCFRKDAPGLQGGTTDLERDRMVRIATLAALDVEAFRQQLVDDGALGADRASPGVLITAMHKARYEMPTFADHVREQSRAFLAKQGMGRTYGGPLLPPGEFPKGQDDLS